MSLQIDIIQDLKEIEEDKKDTMTPMRNVKA